MAMAAGVEPIVGLVEQLMRRAMHRGTLFCPAAL
jgi:hypothetical protein